MAKRRKKPTVRRDPPIAPTPETKAKMTADPLRVMVEKGFIDANGKRRYLTPEGEQSVDEIRKIWFAVCREVMSKGMSFGREPRGRAEMPEWIARAHAKVFLPWAEAHKGQMDLILSVVVDRLEPDAWLCHVVADALYDYARYRRAAEKSVDRAACAA